MKSLSNNTKWLLGLIGFVLLLMCFQRSCGNTNGHLFSGGPKPVETSLSDEEESTIEIFERVAPSVVFIKNAAYQRDFFSLDISEIPQGAGSGFIWDNRGHIITNFHVIYQADKIDVVLSNQKVYQAKIVGFSPEHDLAVLKIEAPGDELKPFPLGISKNLKVGQKVSVIGNPFGLDHTLTTGVLSAVGRSIRSLTGGKIYDVIQTDAAINPGNSGGPLLDSDGNLIGVTTAIFSPSGAYAGVGFAIPVDTVNRVVPQLIKYGAIKRAGLGILLVPDPIRRKLGLRKGAMIMEIIPSSAAELAGLQPTRRTYTGQIAPGDIIVEINGQKIEDNDDLIRYLEKSAVAGQEIKIGFMRDGRKRQSATAVL